MHASKSHSIAQDLLKSLSGPGSAQELPSVRDLASQRKISYATAWKVLQILKAKGFAVTRPGMKTVRAGVDQQSAPARFSALVRTRIQDGIYRAGKPLPKISYLTATDKVSSETVAKSFRQLVRDGLLHRQGRSWVVGSAQQYPQGSRLTSSQALPSVVLLQIFSLDDWNRSFTSHQLASFMVPLRNELATHGIGMMPVVDPDMVSSTLGIPLLYRDIHHAISDLGERYRGTVTIAQKPTNKYFGTFLSRICKAGMPVIYFDHGNDSPAIGRGKFGIDSRYHRMWFDHKACAELAIQSLADRGHHCVSIPGAGFADWTRKRAKLLVKSAAHIAPGMRILVDKKSSPLLVNAFSDPMLMGFVSKLDNLAYDNQSGRSKLVSPSRAHLTELFPSVISHLNDGATVVVALNDYVAVRLYLYLRALGLLVPKDISIISFDNEPMSSLFPISTTDFGFAHLGYHAAHVFIGDIPLKTGRTGEVAGVPTLIHRGSLGPV